MSAGLTPTSQESDRRRQGISGGLEMGFGLAFVVSLHELGWAVPGNIWFFCAFLVGGALLLQWALGAPGAGSARRISRSGTLGTGLQVAYAGGVIYLTGWGPVLAIGFVQLGTMLGSLGRTWRTVLCMSLTAIGVGQAAIALGLTSTYLPSGTAQAAGVLGAVCAAMAIRVLGMADSARSAAEGGLAASEERFRTVLQDSRDVTVITDDTGSTLFVSSAVEHVMGWTVDDYRTRRDVIVHPEDRAAAKDMADDLLAGSRGHQTELRLLHGDGSWHWHEVSARNLMDNPAVGGLVFNHRDITPRKQHQERLAYEAAHDPLTGLANRAALREVLEGSGTGTGKVAVLYLDLDGFKRVNDELGHAVGDELLVHAAKVLRECVLGRDTVARLGGDEFVVVLSEVGDPRDAIAVAERIIERLREPATLEGSPIRIRTSIGIAMADSPDQTAAILRSADAAMYEAKRAGTHGWRLFDENPLGTQAVA